eukprot:jgi/Picre1/28935/NNA_004330.t1
MIYSSSEYRGCRHKARALSSGEEDQSSTYGDEMGYDVDAVTADWREYRAGMVAKEHRHAGTKEWAGLGREGVQQTTRRRDWVQWPGAEHAHTSAHCKLGLEVHIAESLGQCPLYIGGPVTRNLLHVLHGNESVEGSMEIIKGVYAGGVESAAELVLQGVLIHQNFACWQDIVAGSLIN